MCVWRRDSPRRYPEAGGDSSGSAADESGQTGRRQTAPHPVLSGRSFSVQVCPTQDAQQLRVKFLCSCYKSAEIKLEKHFVQNVIWCINEAYFTMPCMTLEKQVWKYLHNDGFNKFVHYCDCFFIQAWTMGAGEEGGGLGLLGWPTVPLCLLSARVWFELGVRHPSATGLWKPPSLLASPWSWSTEDNGPSTGPVRRCCGHRVAFQRGLQ